MTHSQMELKLKLSNAFGPFFPQFLTLFFGNWSNKNAFQLDAYLPLVDHIPACIGQGVCIPACTGQGVCILACTGQRGCMPACIGQGGVSDQGGVWPRGMSGRGDVCLGDVCTRVCVADTPLNQRQTPPVNRMTDRQV